VTVEFAADLGTGLCCGRPIVLCLWPVTDVFQLKLHWIEVQTRFVEYDNTFIYCSVLCAARCTYI